MQFPVIRYNDEEYLAVVAPESDEWSREESDYLLDLCEAFSLRWFVIHDRYNVREEVGIDNGTEPGRWVWVLIGLF